MLTTAEFFIAFKWAGILTLVSGFLGLLGFLLKWGVRFRLVGITGFMAVLTGGLFALSLVPLTRVQVPGALHYARVYDNDGSQTVIALPPTITESELELTLRQAANNLFSQGRFSSAGENQLTIRARTIVHPEPGLSKPLFLGQVKRSLGVRDDENMEIEIYADQFSELSKLKPAAKDA
ncbi:Ycf51 family protein [Phormidium pseudopriestleyi FRX01]|uniref:Ycf51 family protein n=1 Tax=Phormidium pseudopriestleyi FRX01 TaxID=1759528 RepID=A0ABS3FNQ9_9CYAN|nr:Ycf51 family protein [Phormidium pseudopriestleyi]MBO0348741.1 Ycf51 family protein [Phormidium pseudopriestleyi FRX01]